MRDRRPSLSQVLSLSSPDWQSYELLDSGDGQKLERFEPYLLVRPEPKATWSPTLDRSVWQGAHATLKPSGRKGRLRWQFHRPVAQDWTMQYKGLQFRVQATSSRHVGVFPENAAHWDWIEAQVARAQPGVRVLDLFAYTGLATLAAARAGAQVTHVDAARRVVAIARDNQALSGLTDCTIRWIVDDALKFVQREGRRGKTYEGIVMDPPRFGRGPKGQVWDFFEHLDLLCRACRAVLSAHPLFVVITAYALEATAQDLAGTLIEMMDGLGGSVEAGTLVTVERSAGHTIPNAVFARWSFDMD